MGNESKAAIKLSISFFNLKYLTFEINFYKNDLQKAKHVFRKYYFEHMNNGKYFKVWLDAASINLDNEHYGQGGNQSVRYGLKRGLNSGDFP